MRMTEKHVYNMNPLSASIVETLNNAYHHCIDIDNHNITFKEQKKIFDALNSALSEVIERRNEAINNSIPTEVLQTAVTIGTGSFTVLLDPMLERLINDASLLLNKYFSSFTTERACED